MEEEEVWVEVEVEVVEEVVEEEHLVLLHEVEELLPGRRHREPCPVLVHRLARCQVLMGEDRCRECQVRPGEAR